ncbi:hypothetical protein GTQ43_38925 [Nostoc sp. KVJ3]|nr:hypothetical protein [Nostoc sp. KVJ3]
MIAAFAYIIKDVRAKFGIIVTTSGLQSGAKKVADAENIRLIEVHQNSTDENFFVRFPEHHQSVAAFTDKRRTRFCFFNISNNDLSTARSTTKVDTVKSESRDKQN